MFGTLSTRWIKGGVLAIVLCCLSVDSAEARCRRRGLGRGIGTSAGEAVGQAVGQAVGDTILTLLGVLTFNPQLVNGEAAEPTPPPEPLIDPAWTSAWTTTWKVGNLISQGMADEVDESDLTKQGLELAVEFLESDSALLSDD